MKFKIVDCNNNEIVGMIESNNGKNALRIFRRQLLSTGFYEIHKRLNRWILSSSFGSYFVAMPENGGMKKK